MYLHEFLGRIHYKTDCMQISLKKKHTFKNKSCPLLLFFNSQYKQVYFSYKSCLHSLQYWSKVTFTFNDTRDKLTIATQHVFCINQECRKMLGNHTYILRKKRQAIFYIVDAKCIIIHLVVSFDGYGHHQA